MKLTLIDTGYFYADGGAMFGAVPKTAWSRRYVSDDKNRCVLAMRSLLIQTDCGRNILIDAGAGMHHPQQLTWYQFFDLQTWDELLAKVHLSTDQITDVVFTHLHFDHAGGAIISVGDNEAKNSYALRFPKATHWVSETQWHNAQHPHPLEEDSFFVEELNYIQSTRLLRCITEDTPLCASVELRLYAGHTPGQLVPYVQHGEETVVFAGDVIPLSASVSPAWISAYDLHPTESYTEKLRLLDEATRLGQTLIFCHDAYTPFCEIQRVNDTFLRKRSEKLFQMGMNIRFGVNQ